MRPGCPRLFQGVALALAGLAIAAFLTVEHYTSPALLACPENAVINCRKVTSSPQSAIAGFRWSGSASPTSPPWPPPACRPPGAAATAPCAPGGCCWPRPGSSPALYLVCAELFEINAICLWCTAVHVISALLFALTAFGTALASGPLPRAG